MSDRSGLIVPVVLWGGKCSQNRITHVCCIRNGSVIITGTTDGYVVQWSVDETLGWIQPQLTLIGHETPISCVAPASTSTSSTRYVTCSEDGQMCLWDSVDGRAVESVRHQYVHRKVIPHRLRISSHHYQTRLLCVGDYAEILVVDGQDLNVLFNLSSRVEPDWINALTVVQSEKHDVVIGVSRSSMIKLWSLADLDKKDATSIVFEDESKVLNARNVQSIACSMLNTRMMLVISPTTWQVIDPSNLNQLVVSECAIEAISGAIIDVDRIAVGFADATIVLFQLPRSKLSGKQVVDRFGESPSNVGNVEQPFVFALLRGVPVSPASPLTTANFYFDFRTANGHKRHVALRTDHQGSLSVWQIPKNHDLLVEEFMRSRRPVAYEPTIRQSFNDFWSRLNPTPPTISAEQERKITATIFVGNQGKLLLGRDDGSIVMMYACDVIAAQFLESSSMETLHQRLLSGHTMAVNCFLYPFEESHRYDPQLLLSGGEDFAVIVWNITTGCKTYRFCCQGGPILRLLVPPDNCSPRVLHTVCSVAGDNSVALLSLKENKCTLLASRQQYPIVDVRWRPLDDFMLVRCEDESVYVWQMETANLDRIVAGVLSDDVMEASKEQIGIADGDDEAGASQAVQVFRALKNRNVAAIKKIAALGDKSQNATNALSSAVLPSPMDIVQLRKCSDQSYLILFNVDSLITGLLSMDYEISSSAHSDTVSEHSRPSLSSLISKRSDHHAARHHLPNANTTPSNHKASGGPALAQRWQVETNLYMDTARLLMSLLYGWNLDEPLDNVCISKLRLQKPKMPICYGAISRRGHISLYMPYCSGKSPALDDMSYRNFSKKIRWQSNKAITTVHVLSVVAIANTLMSLRSRSLHHIAHRPSLRRISSTKSSDSASDGENQQMKQGWSNVAALHCVLLPDLVKPEGSYAAPKIELLVRRWQDSCVEIRDASQALLIRELNRLGVQGRKELVKFWSSFLPTSLDSSLSIFGSRFQPAATQNGSVANGTSTTAPNALSAPLAAPPSQPTGTSNGPPPRPAPPVPPRQPGVAQLPRVEATSGSTSSSSAESQLTSLPTSAETEECSGLNQVRRNQATSIVLLAVIGAEFPPDVQDNADVVRAISQSLLELLNVPESSLLPLSSPLRRAAVDLIGRGFVVWQPHLDISKVLLALLDLASSCDSTTNTTEPFGTPLPALMDACKTARHALSLIASARPQALITALSMEVARYNSAAQHQTIQHAVTSPLIKSRTEVLRLIEQLSDKQYNDVAELIIPVGDILVHCLDMSLLKQRTLSEIFPPIAKFYMIAYCAATRRIAFGGRNGTIVVHELRALKAQTIQAHKAAITAVAFSPDGKFLAAYASEDAKISFWQTQQTFLGMGQNQIRCAKTVPAPSEFPVLSPGGTYQTFRARLVWINAKSLTLMLPNGKENRFTI